ncbi:MAG: hypothetical protein IJ308_04305 [Clostridia bacterium]|nr:hypothetical protein [Clostridia bacterium]
MKWSVSVGVRLCIDYDDIEADNREEAEEIAKDRASEDIDWNNADLDDVMVYTCYPTEDDNCDEGEDDEE